jgi:hypothetical protein
MTCMGTVAPGIHTRGVVLPFATAQWLFDQPCELQCNVVNHFARVTITLVQWTNIIERGDVAAYVAYQPRVCHTIIVACVPLAYVII